MNVPPLDEGERVVYHELFTEIRHMRESLGKSIEKVHDSLDLHVQDESGQYAQVQSQLSEVNARLTRLETRWGLLATFAAFVGAAVMAALQKVFF